MRDGCSRERDQLGRVASIEREFLDSLVLNDPADCGAAGFDQRRCRFNGDRFGEFADGHLDDDLGISVDLQNDSSALECAESG